MTHTEDEHQGAYIRTLVAIPSTRSVQPLGTEPPFVAVAWQPSRGGLLLVYMEKCNQLLCLSLSCSGGGHILSSKFKSLQDLKLGCIEPNCNSLQSFLRKRLALIPSGKIAGMNTSQKGELRIANISNILSLQNQVGRNIHRS